MQLTSWSTLHTHRHPSSAVPSSLSRPLSLRRLSSSPPHVPPPLATLTLNSSYYFRRGEPPHLLWNNVFCPFIIFPSPACLALFVLQASRSPVYTGRCGLRDVVGWSELVGELGPKEELQARGCTDPCNGRKDPSPSSEDMAPTRWK